MVRRDVLAGEGSRRDHPTGKLDAGMGVDGNQNPSECERDAERRRRYGLTPVPELTGHTRVFSYYLGVLFSTGWTRESTKAFENALVAGQVRKMLILRTLAGWTHFYQTRIEAGQNLDQI